MNRFVPGGATHSFGGRGMRGASEQGPAAWAMMSCSGQRCTASAPARRPVIAHNHARTVPVDTVCILLGLEAALRSRASCLYEVFVFDLSSRLSRRTSIAHR